MKKIIKRDKLLGIHLEGRLNLKFYINTIKKARKKCHALAIVCNYIKLNKRRRIINAFIKPKFSSFLFCPNFSQQDCKLRS